MNPESNITGIILAGGKSSRMGREKGLILLNGQPFVQHCIEAMQPLTKNILIVSQNPAYDVFGVQRIEDQIKESGPIAGLHTGLLHSDTKNNLVLSCDVPLVTTALLKKLLMHQEQDYDVVQFEAEKKTIPLVALYKKRCAEKCFKLLSKGEKRLRILVSELYVKTIAVDQKDQFLVKNINTVEDLKTITHASNA